MKLFGRTFACATFGSRTGWFCKVIIAVSIWISGTEDTDEIPQLSSGPETLIEVSDEISELKDRKANAKREFTNVRWNLLVYMTSENVVSQEVQDWSKALETALSSCMETMKELRSEYVRSMNHVAACNLDNEILDLVAKNYAVQDAVTVRLLALVSVASSQCTSRLPSRIGSPTREGLNLVGCESCPAQKEAESENKSDEQ